MSRSAHQCIDLCSSRETWLDRKGEKITEDRLDGEDIRRQTMGVVGIKAGGKQDEGERGSRWDKWELGIKAECRNQIPDRRPNLGAIFYVA